MVDEERLKLMTRMASFEDNEGKKTIPVCEFFRSDYVGLHMLLTAVYVTLAFALVAGINIFCGIESFLADFYRTDFLFLGRELLRKYLIVLGIYLVVSFFVYTVRYTRARKSNRTYQKALRRLSQMNSSK